MKVLIAEDEAELAAAYHEVLAASFPNWTLQVAHSLGEALPLADASVDVLLTDYDLGDGTGANLARAYLAAKPDGCVMLQSAFASAADVQTLKQEGIIHEAWTKPIPLAEVIQALEARA